MTFAESLAQATKSGICQLTDSFANVNALLKRVGTPGAGSFSNYWRALNRSLCNKEQPGGDPPIEGGQCPVQYDLFISWDESSGFTCVFVTQDINRTLWGPILGVELKKRDPQITLNPRWDIFVTSFGRGQIPTLEPVTERFVEFINAGESCRDPQIIDIIPTRLDGLPDDCEGIIPPPPPPPGWNIIIIPNFTWINNEGDVINEGDLNLEFGFAYFNDSFDLDIPIKIDLGGLTFNGTFNIDAGGFNFDFSRDIINNNGPPGNRPPDGPNDPPPPGLPGTPDNPGDIEPDPDVREDDDDEEGDSEGESRIVAARVVISSVNNESIGVFLQNRNPDIAIPNYGYIQFFIPTGDGEGAWSADIPVKNANAFIPCPWPDGAIAVRGTARQGVFWSIQALRSEISTKIVYP